MAVKSREMIRDFTEGSVAKQLITFASPLFLSNLLQIVYNMADMVIVGQVSGKTGISAISVGGDVSHFLTFLAMGFSNAGQVIISQYIGAGQREKIGKFIGTMFSFLFSCAIALSILCLAIRTPILQWMNTPAEAWDEAMRYSTTCMAGLVFIYGYNMVSAVLRGMGDSRHPFLFISMAAVLNILLDLLFVMQLGWGAFGAALATVISQAFSFLCAVIFLFRRRASFGFHMGPADFRVNGEMVTSLLKLGIPMALKSAAVQFSKLFVNAWINSYGVVVSAVAGIGSKLNSVGNLVSNSMNTAGASMIGQNIGAQKYRRVTKIVLIVLGINGTLSIGMAAVLLFFPEQVFGLFDKSAAVLEVAMVFLPIGALNLLSSAFRAPANALINGSGNFKVNFILAILDGIILRIGLALLFGLGFDMGYFGFWLGDCIASFTPFFIGAAYYCSGTWKTRKYLIKEDN